MSSLGCCFELGFRDMQLRLNPSRKATLSGRLAFEKLLMFGLSRIATTHFLSQNPKARYTTDLDRILGPAVLETAAARERPQMSIQTPSR